MQLSEQEGNIVVEMFIAASVDPVKSILHTWKPGSSDPSAFPSKHAEAGAHPHWLNPSNAPKPLAFGNLFERYF